jgi:hypothetical protein
MTVPVARCGDADELDAAAAAAVDIAREAAEAVVVDVVCVCVFGCEEAESEDVEGGCWRKAARKEERKKGRWEDGILASLWLLIGDKDRALMMYRFVFLFVSPVLADFLSSCYRCPTQASDVFELFVVLYLLACDRRLVEKPYSGRLYFGRLECRSFAWLSIRKISPASSPLSSSLCCRHSSRRFTIYGRERFVGRGFNGMMVRGIICGQTCPDVL